MTQLAGRASVVVFCFSSCRSAGVRRVRVGVVSLHVHKPLEVYDVQSAHASRPECAEEATAFGAAMKSFGYGEHRPRTQNGGALSGAG